MTTTKDKVRDLISSFDSQQKTALDAMLKSWDTDGSDKYVLPIVDGPPGTGKTTIGTAAVAEYLLNNPRANILYMCYTNFAAARAQEKLYELGFTPNEVVRLTSNPNDTGRSPGVVGLRWDFTNISPDDTRALHVCSILLCTLLRARLISSKLRSLKTRVVVDEFSQVNAPMFFSTMQRISDVNPSNVALLGDPRQLPVITTQSTLSPNICSFITNIKGYAPHGLKLQHRMHDGICAAVNSLRRALVAPYDLKTADHVKDQDLLQLGYNWDERGSPPEFREILRPQHPFVIVDTDGLSGTEEQIVGGSTKNVAEANYAVRLANAFYESYRKPTGERLQAMILSPYSAQVTEIRNIFRNLSPHLREQCTTIFRSQGREYPCVIVSFVRNNPKKFIGFLKEPELRAQMYVACSRPQAKLVVLLSHNTFLGAGYMDFDYLCATPGAYLVKT
jgi:superfamily I DNA and/or RNA helicase